MIKTIVVTMVMLLFQGTYSQVTFLIDRIPENTPEDISIYISGDFEGWSGGQESYRLTKVVNTFSITLPKQIGSIEFKFTQGSWETVERGSEGNEIGNRKYIFGEKHDTVNVKITSWEHSNVIQSPTTTDNAFVLSNDFEIPQLNRTRRIWIYLPPNYDTSHESFPVLYMHDGQNIFDANSSYSGEWGIDETLNKLYEEQKFKLIVVGIDNGQGLRLDEYSPWENEKYGGGEGDAYLEFIVETLKPYIDQHYNTLTDKDNTAIMGSSMGGLISHYAGMKYSAVFGKVGVFSPAFWFAPEINEFTQMNGNIPNSKIYFLAGGMEEGNVVFEEINQTVMDMNTIQDILIEQGFPSENIALKVVPEGKHNEELWRNGFEESILWLFDE
jgi:alpha-glucosidase